MVDKEFIINIYPNLSDKDILEVQKMSRRVNISLLAAAKIVSRRKEK